MYKRIIISIILSVLIVLVSLGIASFLTVRRTISRALNSRVETAMIIARNTDSLIEKSLNRLYDISLSGAVNFADRSWEPEKKALKTAYQYSIFTDGVFLLDKEGRVALTYPARFDKPDILLDIPYIKKIMADGRPVISNIYTLPVTQRKVIYALVPLKSSRGEIIGVAGGEINPTSFALHEIIAAVPTHQDDYVEIVDTNGVVIASNRPSRLFTGSDHNRFITSLITSKSTAVRQCHRCHESGAGGSASLRTDDILAFAPLSMAPWGVSILQPQWEVFAPAEELKRIFLIAGICSIGISLLIAVGMSRSIVKPVHELIRATEHIAAGDMSREMGFGGSNEIGKLSSSFEVMRLKLADSLETLQQYNVELERKILDRTREIRISRNKIARLLEKVITVQEEERKRIAREIHDDTMQTLSALLLKLEMVKLRAAQADQGALAEVQDIIVRTLSGLRTIIQNLRPSILDDIGLEAAIRWLLDKHLGEHGIEYSFTLSGESGRRFNPYVETTIFRIVQEAINNISRHAEAENVFVVMHVGPKAVTVDIEDDGPGFDTAEALRLYENGRGYGILGMKERAALLEGDLQICSREGHGTRISLNIPLEPYGESHGKNSTPHR